MRAPSPGTVLAPCFVLGLIQLLATLLDPVWGVIAAILVGSAAFGFERLLELHFDPWWLLAPFAATGSAAGVLVAALVVREHRIILLLAPVFAGAIAILLAFLSQDNSRRCDLCHRRLDDEPFECPRCGLIVCNQSCWIFDACRCRQCEEHRVRILNSRTGWWDREFGPRIRQGKCQLCLTAGEKTDLRTCQRCGRPYCRSCWDTSNGQCRHCLWVVKDLPASLERYVVRYNREERTRSGRTRYPRTSNRIR